MARIGFILNNFFISVNLYRGLHYATYQRRSLAPIIISPAAQVGSKAKTY
jgi:hypothetical protein